MQWGFFCSLNTDGAMENVQTHTQRINQSLLKTFGELLKIPMHYKKQGCKFIARDSTQTLPGTSLFSEYHTVSRYMPQGNLIFIL
jgi:hypothetical protein